MNNWKSHNRHKYLLQFHLIFVCKYRKQLMRIPDIANSIKELSLKICCARNVTIKHMETDNDHIHYLIETSPTIRLSDLVRTVKSYTAFHIWKLHEPILHKYFWKERTFWSDGYFVCSVGDVSAETLRKYIEGQG